MDKTPHTLRRISRSFGRAVSKGYLYCRRSLSASARRCRRAALRVGRAIKTTYGGLRRIPESLSRAFSRGYPYYRHSLPTRIMHWSNVLFVALLLMSGLNIFDAHPALYWGKSSYSGAPPVLEIWGQEDDSGRVSGVTRVLGRDFDTTGFLGASGGREGELAVRSFPSWLTIPGQRWLAMARGWHFFFAWLFVINGIAFVVHSVVSGHVRRDLAPTRQDVRSVGRSVMDHLRFRHARGEASKRYNVLQKFAYLGVIFFLLPLMILMGLGMSPALDALYPGWVDIFLGRQSVRTIHFVVAWAIVLFVAVHVFEVIITGFWNNLRSMITGYYRIKPEADRG